MVGMISAVGWGQEAAPAGAAQDPAKTAADGRFGRR